MKHLSEEQALALAMGYGSPDAAEHAAACPACQAAAAVWQQTVAAADAFLAPAAPEPDVIWQHIAPRLDETAKVARHFLPWSLPLVAWSVSFDSRQGPPAGAQGSSKLPPAARPAWRAWALAAGVCLAALVFWTARPRSVPQPTATVVLKPSPVLRFAVAQHLDRSQVLLVELAHADELPGSAIDLSLEKSSARDLLNANRLYHQSAALQGDAMMAHVLSALEPPLLEIAHSPNQLPPAAWRQMQQRIAASGVLFKVRVFDETLHAQHGAL